MNLCEIFIRRPIMTSLVMLAILLFGILGYRDLAVSDLPNVDFPTIQVSAGLPGASPDTMASSIATPLEKQFTSIAGLDSMTSTSALGNTQITLQFALSRTIDSAAVDVQTAISAAANQLPPNLPSPPTFRKVNPADQPIFGLAVTSPTLPLYEVDKYAENFIAEQMSEVAGVAQVSVGGAARYASHFRHLFGDEILRIFIDFVQRKRRRGHRQTEDRLIGRIHFPERRRRGQPGGSWFAAAEIAVCTSTAAESMCRRLFRC